MGQEAYQYNAFISYRRTPHDTLVAREIQHSLERFRLPRGIRQKSGKEKINRIFRDQEELEITADLSGRIEQALVSSEFLIVICSPEYSQSPWCLHELETFLKLRDYEHVLCVLSAGEPPSVFPDALLHRTQKVIDESGNLVSQPRVVEPLACDYRGNFRKARRTELPRLAAAMLGCNYDELVMRRERYRRRRLAAILTAAAVASVSSISYLVWSNAQISRNYRQALISESRLLSAESQDAMKNQDRLAAVSDALYALTGGDPDRPLTEEAQFALAKATYAYETPFSLLETWRVDENNDISDYFISRDGSFLVCMDQSGEFSTYDLQKRTLLSQFRIQDHALPLSMSEGKTGELLCYAGGEVISADYRTGAVNWRETMNYGVQGKAVVSPGGELIAASDSYAVWVMTKEQKPYAGLLLPELDGAYITDLFWSPDGKEIAVILKESSLQTDVPGESVGVFSLESGEFTLLNCNFGKVDLLSFDADGCLYVLGDNRIGESEQYNGTTVMIPIPFELRAYREKTLLWNQQISARTLTETPVLRVDAAAEKRVFLALGSFVYVFNADGVPTGYLETRNDVLQILNISGDTFSFVTGKGELGTGWPSSGICRMQTVFPPELSRVVTAPGRTDGNERYVLSSKGNLNIYESVSDENIMLFQGDGFPLRPEGFVHDEMNAALLTGNCLFFYDLKEKTQTGRIDLPEGEAWHLLCSQDGFAYALRIQGEAGDISLVRFDLKAAVQCEEVALPVHDFFCSHGYQKEPFSYEEGLYLSSMYRAPSSVAQMGETLYVHDDSSNKIYRVHLPSGTVSEVPVQLPEEETSVRFVYERSRILLPSPLVVSPDGKTLFTAGTEPETGKQKAFLIRLSDGQVTVLPGEPEDLSSVAFSVNAFGSADAVVYAGHRELYTCSMDGQLISTLTWTGDNPVSFTVYGGKLFCVFPDATLRVFEGTAELRKIPLNLTSDLLTAVVDGRAFRYHFTDGRLYLFCGNDLNAVQLDTEGTTPLYSASLVLDRIESTGSLLLFSSLPAAPPDAQRSEVRMILAEIDEYSPQELAARAREQLEAFLPKS